MGLSMEQAKELATKARLHDLAMESRMKSSQTGAYDPMQLLTTEIRQPSEYRQCISEQGRNTYVEGNFDFERLYRQLFHQNSQTSSVKEHQLQLTMPTDTESTLKLLVSLRMHPTIAPLEWTQFIQLDIDDYLGGGGFADVYGGMWLLSVKDLDLPRIVVKKFRGSPAMALSRDVKQTQDAKHRIRVRI
jgi:hypothetical protein